MRVRRLFSRGGENFPGGVGWGGVGAETYYYVIKLSYNPAPISIQSVMSYIGNKTFQLIKTILML